MQTKYSQILTDLYKTMIMMLRMNDIHIHTLNITEVKLSRVIQ